MADDNKNKARLPKTPVYKWFLDGAKTKKIIEWINRLEDVDVDGIPIDDPALKALLTDFSERIKSLEKAVSDLDITITKLDTLIKEMDMKPISNDEIANMFE